MSFVSNAQRWARQQGAPVTVGWFSLTLIAAIVGFFGNGITSRLFGWSAAHSDRIWGVVTYPFALTLPPGLGIIFFIFLLMWILQMGGSVERDLGTVRYAIFWVVMTVLAALLVTVGGLVTKVDGGAEGPLLTLAAVSVAWCTRHATAPMSFWGIPIQARWIGWLMVAFAFTTYGFANPILGAFACLHLGVAHLFAANRIPGLEYSAPIYKAKPSKAARERDAKYFDEVRAREQERQERERLRKLFEGSLDDKDR